MANASGQSRIYREQVRGPGGGATETFASGAVLLLEAGSSFTFNSTMVVGANALIDLSAGGVGTLVLATGEIAASDLAGNLASGYIPLGAHLFRSQKMASAETLATGIGAQLLTTTGDPSIELTSTGDQSAYLNYTSAIVVGLKVPPIAMPHDLATAGGMTIELFGESVGTATAIDAAEGFDVRAWAGIGDTEMGATHPNFTSTPAWQGITIASGDLTTTILNITLNPQAHANRAFRVYDMRARYTRIA